jgi:hypothetical protein
MVYFLSRGKPALPLALFTKGMGFNVFVPDSLPGTAVSFVGFRVPLILVIVHVHSLLVLGAVLPVNNEPTAAGI